MNRCCPGAKRGCGYRLHARRDLGIDVALLDEIDPEEDVKTCTILIVTYVRSIRLLLAGQLRKADRTDPDCLSKIQRTEWRLGE
jgi:hypothetical protein